MLNKQLLNVKDLYVDVEDKERGDACFDGTERYR